MTGTRGMLAAKQPLVVPMLLRLSHFKLNSYVVLVVSKQKGITLVFKTDPLQNVDINSTFDSIAVIQKFIQREIEGQLRQMFREDLPGIIHRLSQQWIKAKVEAPYLLSRPPPSRRPVFETMSAPDLPPTPSLSSIDVHSGDIYPSPTRPRSASGASSASVNPRLNIASSHHLSKSTITDAATSFPDLENYDPTYGLRPEGLPTKSTFGDFSRLFAPKRGLADLTEEHSGDGADGGEDDGEGESFDMVDWDNSIPDNVSSLLDDVDDVIEYEKIPAVGGGTITRPRIYHSQSMAQPPGEVGNSRPVSLSSQSVDQVTAVRSAPLLRQNTHNGSIHSPTTASYRHPMLHDPTDRLYRTKSESGFDRGPRRPAGTRPITFDSAETHHSRSSHDARSISTSPSSHIHESDAPTYTTFHHSQRRPSISSDGFHSGSPPHHDGQESDAKIVLRPSLNNTIHQLSTLSHSNHTLSPYTRSFAHFTVRSVPPRETDPLRLSLPPDKQHVKAKRKRIYRISAKAKPDVVQDIDAEAASIPFSPPIPPSEFDASELDRYFRSQEDYVLDLPDLHPSHVRRRTYQRQS